MSWTIESLREHLQAALAVEHATIPPYFTAWISIKDTTNIDAAEIIRSVMLEEMLHLTLAARDSSDTVLLDTSSKDTKVET